MYYSRKLKPPILGTEMILGIVASAVFLFLIIFSYQLAMGFGALITLSAALLTGIAYIRTRNKAFLISILAHLFATVFLVQIALFTDSPRLLIFIPTAVLMLIFQILMIIYALQKKMKWRSREILELAAQHIDRNRDSFTRRPMHIGKSNHRVDELTSFAKFLRKNLIAIPVKEKDRWVFIINMPWEKFISFNKHYRKYTYVAFDYDGDVTVSISQEDYFMYRDQLAFDQLCNSLGNLFINFLDQYNKDQAILIMEQFNALKLNIITEG